MIDEQDIIKNLSSHFSVQIMKAFGNIDASSKALEIIAKSLNDVYRYFEPSFFNGEFLVCKNFKDEMCLEEKKGMNLYDKNILLNKNEGTVIIQVFDDGRYFLWENEAKELLLNKADTLIYYFNNNKEYFLANKIKIDITLCPIGSRFATQFVDLADAIMEYAVTKIFHSSCPHFSESWADDKRIFFKGGGRGSNIPEKFMQKSLFEFLNTYTFMLRGITIDAIREFNVGSNNPKPVDITIHWKEANRRALIEIKFLGAVKGDNDEILYRHDNPKANAGIIQLKGYHDSAVTDLPTTIIKSYLVVIDGRRNNINKTTKSIPYSDGMHFKDIEIKIDSDKKFHESIVGFEKPIKMFATPVCS